MTTASKDSDDNICDRCAPKKTVAITLCHGCDHHFCRKHFNEHRDQLSKYFNNLVDLHDQIRQDLQTRIDHSLKDQLDNNDAKRLLQQIDEWVERTINTCLHVADEARASVKQLFDKTKDNDSLTHRLSTVSREFEEQQKSENFVERDLDRWMKQLKKLKEDIHRPIEFPTDIIIKTRNIDWKETIKICQQSNSNKNIEHYVLVSGETGVGL
jgi:transcriptional regulator with GAF, ATPase, and Fis domain